MIEGTDIGNLGKGTGTIARWEVLELKADMPISELIEQLQWIQRQSPKAVIPFQNVWEKKNVQLVDAAKIRVPIELNHGGRLAPSFSKLAAMAIEEE